MIAEGWLIIYMDDLLIFSPDEDTHRERTKCVLQRMMELDLHLKLEKCRFATNKVEYLGMIVKPRQLAMDPVKLDGIASWPTPKKVKDVRSFLGFANFYLLWLSTPNSNITDLVVFFPFLYLIRLTYDSHTVPMFLFSFHIMPHALLIPFHLRAVHGYALLLFFHSATAVRLPHAPLRFHSMAMLDAHFYLMLLESRIF